MMRIHTQTETRTKTVRRLALGLLAALAVTVGIVAGPVAGSAHAESLSVCAADVHHCPAPDFTPGRGSGEEIPQRL